MPPNAGEYVVSVDIGCQPSFSGSAETVLQTENLTLVVFRAISIELPMYGCYDNLGFAVVECVRCIRTQFGYPNDEGLPEHPLYNQGLSDAYGVAEVVNSSWATALAEQMTTTAERKFGNSYNKMYNLAEGEIRNYGWKHFIFQFKENTFECIADGLKLRSVGNSYQDTMDLVNQMVAEE